MRERGCYHVQYHQRLGPWWLGRFRVWVSVCDYPARVGDAGAMESFRHWADAHLAGYMGQDDGELRLRTPGGRVLARVHHGTLVVGRLHGPDEPDRLRAFSFAWRVWPPRPGLLWAAWRSGRALVRAQHRLTDTEFDTLLGGLIAYWRDLAATHPGTRVTVCDEHEQEAEA